jgi:hypothetical protein
MDWKTYFMGVSLGMAISGVIVALYPYIKGRKK